MTRVHIEGMGWMGVVVADTLEQAGISFTWHDTETDVAAWPISTGIVYPAGDKVSMGGHAEWGNWIAERRFGPYAEACAYWYTHKNPPHEGKYRAAVDLGWARMGEVPAYQVNVAEIVNMARARYASQRLDAGDTAADVYVVAHGFGPRMKDVVWGWAAEVGLAIPGEITAASGERRPTFYTRDGRFKMAYAYAIPTRETWWAGSALIAQPRPKRLETAKHFANWAATFAKMLPGVEVTFADEARQAWRPRGNDDSAVAAIERWNGRQVIAVPSLWHSGVRWAPHVARSTLTLVKAALKAGR